MLLLLLLFVDDGQEYKVLPHAEDELKRSRRALSGGRGEGKCYSATLIPNTRGRVSASASIEANAFVLVRSPITSAYHLLLITSCLRQREGSGVAGAAGIDLVSYAAGF